MTTDPLTKSEFVFASTGRKVAVAALDGWTDRKLTVAFGIAVANSDPEAHLMAHLMAERMLCDALFGPEETAKMTGNEISDALDFWAEAKKPLPQKS